jgi:hypothetical protein
MRVANGPRGEGAAQDAMPLLDIERPQLAQHLGADVRHDLVLQELPIALRRPR